MVSTHPLISKSSGPFNNPSVTVQRAPIRIGINVTFMFQICFYFSRNVEVLILLFNVFQFTLLSTVTASSTTLKSPVQTIRCGSIFYSEDSLATFLFCLITDFVNANVPLVFMVRDNLSLSLSLYIYIYIYIWCLNFVISAEKLLYIRYYNWWIKILYRY